MPFPPFAACRFFDLPPVNLQNLPLHLTKNSFASAPTHLCGIALETRQESQLEGLSSVSLRLTAPSAERVKGDFASAEARRWTEPVWQLSDRPRHPFGSLTLLLGSNPTLAGRGGSVSRRDHNQATGNRAYLSGGTNSEERRNPSASRSSGEGVWGRGASLREAASPPESPHRKSLREGARGRGLLS